MGGISGIGGGGSGGAAQGAEAAGSDEAVDMAMLKEAQDFAKDINTRLLEALPKPPSPPGVGGNLDVMA